MNAPVITSKQTILARKSWTSIQLEQLKPGEVMVYYRGNLTADIKHSEPKHGEGTPDGGAPQYLAMLQDIKQIATKLEQLGRVSLTERVVHGGKVNETKQIEYSARGR